MRRAAGRTSGLYPVPQRAHDAARDEPIMRQTPCSPAPAVAARADDLATLERSAAPPTGDDTLAAVLDDLAFFRGFVAHPRRVGSIVPSSRSLTRRVIRTARLHQAQCVVELGPGIGSTTRDFLAAMRSDAALLAIELDAGFHARILKKIADARLHAQWSSAERIGELLRAGRLPAPDAVVSGIPFSTMPAHVARRIVSAIHGALAPGGRFVAYQLRAHVADFMVPLMGAAQVQWEILNVPPMRVFCWTKPAR